MPTKKEWEHLRNLDRLAKNAPRGTYRERYLHEQIRLLRDKMGLSRWSATWANGDAAANEELPDGLPANTDLFGDL